MKEYKIYCDHCGKELNTLIDYNDAEVDVPSCWFDTDLCAECVKKLADMCKKFCNKENEQ